MTPQAKPAGFDNLMPAICFQNCKKGTSFEVPIENRMGYYSSSIRWNSSI